MHGYAYYWLSSVLVLLFCCRGARRAWISRTSLTPHQPLTLSLPLSPALVLHRSLPADDPCEVLTRSTQWFMAARDVAAPVFEAIFRPFHLSAYGSQSAKLPEPSAVAVLAAAELFGKGQEGMVRAQAAHSELIRATQQWLVSNGKAGEDSTPSTPTGAGDVAPSTSSSTAAAAASGSAANSTPAAAIGSSSSSSAGPTYTGVMPGLPEFSRPLDSTGFASLVAQVKADLRSPDNRHILLFLQRYLPHAITYLSVCTHFRIPAFAVVHAFFQNALHLVIVSLFLDIQELANVGYLIVTDMPPAHWPRLAGNVKTRAEIAADYSRFGMRHFSVVYGNPSPFSLDKPDPKAAAAASAAGAGKGAEGKDGGAASTSSSVGADGKPVVDGLATLSALLAKAPAAFAFWEGSRDALVEADAGYIPGSVTVDDVGYRTQVSLAAMLPAQIAAAGAVAASSTSPSATSPSAAARAPLAAAVAGIMDPALGLTPASTPAAIAAAVHALTLPGYVSDVAEVRMLLRAGRHADVFYAVSARKDSNYYLLRLNVLFARLRGVDALVSRIARAHSPYVAPVVKAATGTDATPAKGEDAASATAAGVAAAVVGPSPVFAPQPMSIRWLTTLTNSLGPIVRTLNPEMAGAFATRLQANVFAAALALPADVHRQVTAREVNDLSNAVEFVLRLNKWDDFKRAETREIFEMQFAFRTLILAAHAAAAAPTASAGAAANGGTSSSSTSTSTSPTASSAPAVSSPSSFSWVPQRIAAINSLANAVDVVLAQNEYNRLSTGAAIPDWVQNVLRVGHEKSSYRPTIQNSVLSTEFLAQFLLDNRVLELVCDPATAHVELSRRTQSILKLLLGRKQLALAHLGTSIP